MLHAHHPMNHLHNSWFSRTFICEECGERYSKSIGRGTHVTIDYAKFLEEERLNPEKRGFCSTKCLEKRHGPIPLGDKIINFFFCP